MGLHKLKKLLSIVSLGLLLFFIIFEIAVCYFYGDKWDTPLIKIEMSLLAVSAVVIVWDLILNDRIT